MKMGDRSLALLEDFEVLLKLVLIEIEILLLIDKVIETTPSIFVTKPKFMRKEKKKRDSCQIVLCQS